MVANPLAIANGLSPSAWGWGRRGDNLCVKEDNPWVYLATHSEIYSYFSGGKVWYGQGVYFAVHSKYSAINNYSPPDQNGLKRMFLVKVLTGEYADVYRGYTDKFAPLKPDSNTERFDSVCDDVQNPQEFVIFRDTAAYPEYVISF